MLHGAIDGDWNGNTSQGNAVSLTVSDHQISPLKWRVSGSAAGCSRDITFTVANPPTDVDGNHAFVRTHTSPDAYGADRRAVAGELRRSQQDQVAKRPVRIQGCIQEDQQRPEAVAEHVELIGPGESAGNYREIVFEGGMITTAKFR